MSAQTTASVENWLDFSFKDKPITVMLDDKGDPWWIAGEVCQVIGLTDTGKSVERLDPDEKLTRKVFVSGQTREVWMVNEPGLYSLILRSTKPQAKAFKRWITHDVIPSIRKTGSYSVRGSDPKQVAANLSRIEILEMALAAEKENQELRLLTGEQNKQIEDMKPIVEMGERFLSSPDCISITEFSKVALFPKEGGGYLSPKALFWLLRDMKVLCEKPWNAPRQKYLDLGWFRVFEYTYRKRNGETGVSTITRITTKGQKELHDLVSKFLTAKS